MYSTYIFDLYGTLIDIEVDENDPEVWEKFAAYLTEKGIPYEKDELHFFYAQKCSYFQKSNNTYYGKRLEYQGPFDYDVDSVFASIIRSKTGVKQPKRDLVRDIELKFRSLTTKHLSAYQGAILTLHILKKHQKKLILLADAQQTYAWHELDVCGLNRYFDSEIYSSSTVVTKPSTLFFSHVEWFMAPPGETLMIGNNVAEDCLPALEQGWDTLYLETKQSPQWKGRLPKGVHKIKNIMDVLTTIPMTQKEIDQEIAEIYEKIAARGAKS